jgi:hypothetical protein
VHWLRFKLTTDQIARFRCGSERVMLGLSHANYGHMAVLSAEARSALARDFA